MTAAILSGRRVVAPLDCRVVAAVGRNSVEHSSGTIEELGSTAGDAAWGCFLIETPGAGLWRSGRVASLGPQAFKTGISMF